MKRFVLTMAVAMAAVCFNAGAQGNKPSGDKDKKETPEKQVEIKVTPGLFGVGHNENDWYFEIPDSLLGRRLPLPAS